MVILAQDYTFRFKDDGITLNPDSLELPFIDVHKVAGLDMPNFRTNERTREGMHGGSLDIDFAEMRTIVIDAEVIANVTSVLPWVEQLKANYAPSNTNYPFYFYGPGIGERTVWCKSLGIKGDWDALLRNGRCAIQIQLKAEDPTIYFGEYVTYTTGLSTGGSGSGYPHGFPRGYGSVITGSNTVNAVNLGNMDVGALIRFTRVINPSVVNDTTGDMLQLNVTVGAGEFYELDLKNNTVRLNGTANRRNLLANASRWFVLQPGDNMLRFNGTANGTAAMEVIYRSGSY